MPGSRGEQGEEGGDRWQGDACPVYQEWRTKDGKRRERDPVTDP